MTGPLTGVRVLELGGIGPGPHAAMLLGDLGADVLRVERPTGGLDVHPPGTYDQLLRGRRAVAADLKDPADLARVRELADGADVLVEGFRPGVAERLRIGPSDCHATNPGLVYARMTGWGQDGPLAAEAGHDINYLALTGVLHAIGPPETPVAPLNLVGDFGGGSAYLVIGVLAALLERAHSGRGQIVDGAIVDGVSSLAQVVWSLRGAGGWSDERADNLIDGGAPFYGTYVCADGRHIAVAALEPRFYAALLRGLGLADAELPDQLDRVGWPVLRDRFAAVVSTRTRDEWASRFTGTDACVTPVLTFGEATRHPHLVARGTLPTLDGVVQAAPAPRFSRTSPPAPAPPPRISRPVARAGWDNQEETSSAQRRDHSARTAGPQGR
ncbi:CaiB/BaiF CoA-transferase family protein [Pseudonocardia nematodicida]|uniref:CaiB/BaiF CoA-transferase family protein n=1 Tax=Pseudonocardia nematodicida TaxID=1206997 RepID=A0ABV1KDX2_9PSEU